MASRAKVMRAKEVNIIRCCEMRWLSVSGHSVPVSELACRYDSQWLSFDHARDMTMSTKMWRFARHGKVEDFARMDDVCCAFQKMRTDQLPASCAARQQIFLHQAILPIGWFA